MKEEIKNTPYLSAHTVDRYQYFIAGAGVGLASSFLSTPFEVVKVRLQHVDGAQYRGSLDAAIRLVTQHRSLSVLYTGHVINTWRELIFCTFYFGGYENLKKGFTEILERQFPGNKSAGQIAIILAGGLAGMLGWMSSYPLDVVKNLKQTQPLDGTWYSRGQNSWRLAADRWAALGLSGFYRGIKPSLLRAFFVSGTRFSAYEFALRLWALFESGAQSTGAPLVTSTQANPSESN